MKVLILHFLLLLSLGSFAQNTIKGTVTDPNGDLLPGASLTVKGTTKAGLALVEYRIMTGQLSIQVPLDIIAFFNLMAKDKYLCMILDQRMERLLIN